MDILNEFFAHVSIPVLGLIVFVFILIFVLAKCFRFPPSFAVKEELRDEIRFRLFDERERVAAEVTDEGAKSDENAESPADAGLPAADAATAAAGGKAAAPVS